MDIFCPQQYKMETNKRLVYNGHNFREFLNRNRITYQEASSTLSIDKNTIGKAVRGGNLNTSILLKICNTYKLSLSDFFSVVEDAPDMDNESEVKEYRFRPEESDLLLAGEREGPYSVAPKTIELLEELIRSKDMEINRLRMLMRLYEERADLLQGKFLDQDD